MLYVLYFYFVGKQSANSFSELFMNFLEKFKITYALRYLIIIIVGFFPICTFYLFFKNLKVKNKYCLFQNLKIFFLSNFLKKFTSTVLYLVMYDWARVVHISYTFSILTFLYLIKRKYFLCNLLNFPTKKSKKKLYFENLK